MTGDQEFTRDQLLRHAPADQSSVRMPRPLGRYLKVLVRLADDAGQPCDQRSLLLALIASTQPDGLELAKLVARYNGMTVGDLPQIVPQGENVVRLPPPRPGRRKRGFDE